MPTKTEDAIKFAHEFGEVIAITTMLDAVIRVRAMKGMTALSLAGSVPNVFAKFADVYFPWQLLRPIDGLAGYACCAARPVVPY